MSMDDASGRTYSDAWHRVASVRACLRSSVRAHRQTFRGEEWVVLRDSLGSDFFRVTADAYAFLSRLNPQRTIDDVWGELMEEQPELALTQEEVVQLLGQLHLSRNQSHVAGISLYQSAVDRSGPLSRACHASDPSGVWSFGRHLVRGARFVGAEGFAG